MDKEKLISNASGARERGDIRTEECVKRRRGEGGGSRTRIMTK